MKPNRARTSLLAQREPMLWLTGGALLLALVMIFGLLALIFAEGVHSLWPQPVVQIQTQDQKTVMGEITRREDGRELIRIGNFEITGNHFQWLDRGMMEKITYPDWALVLERRSWGRFYGTPKAFLIDGTMVSDTPEAIWQRLRETLPEVLKRVAKRRHIEAVEIGKVNKRMEDMRLAMRNKTKTQDQFNDSEKIGTQDFQRLREQINTLNHENERYQLVLATAQGQTKTIALSEIVRAYPANRLSLFQKTGLYIQRWREFLLDEPREANSEGGVFPAIFGTFCMTVLMSLLVVPFGVLAALYLREYAKKGAMVSVIRIAVNNLAGVPSIVFGVFGLGFFCYIVGGSIDQAFFAAKLPNPTFGKGGLLWASLTLALLTLPVVIVATEEALAAVPNSLREGSYACGAGKWQTIRRIVLPRAMPGIMTGMILAMARGAGEVAPLMLVGAVKLAPNLPIDTTTPFVHAERSFMHLGFHIFDLGFQSQNSEAAKPMVFTTTLLLIGLIAVLNLIAVRVRTRLRRHYVTGHF